MKAEIFIANNYHTKVGLEADKLIEDNTGIVVSFEEIAESYHQAKLIWDRMYELKGNKEELYTRKDVENFGLWLGQLPKKQKSKMIDLLFDDWINL